MKLLALSLAGIAFFPAIAQGKPERERRACLVVAKKFLKCQSTKIGIVLYPTPEHISYARTAQVGDKWWPVGDDPITVTLEADSIESNAIAEVTRLTGNVEIHTTKLVLRAAEAVYYSETGEIDASGNVHITPVGK